MHSKKPFRVVCLNYLAYFMIIGSWTPFITIYLQAAGWSGLEIGLFNALGPLAAFLTQPLWGLVSDAWGNVRLLYILLVAATAGTVAFFGLLPVSGLFLALAVLMGIIQGPLTAMLDSMAVQALDRSSDRIGQARLWGSFSFATVALLMGPIFERSHISIFPAFVITSAFAILASLSMPKLSSTEGHKVDFSLRTVRQAVSRPFLFFLGAAFLLQLGNSTSLPFLSLVLVERGASSTIVGYAWSFTALVEIPVFAITRKLLRRYKPEQLVITAGLIQTLRMFLFAITPNPWMLVLIHCIEGLAFPLTTVAFVLLVDELVEPAFKTTGFTLQSAVTYTLPRFLGGIWGGAILDRLGGAGLYVVGAVTALVGTGAMALWNRKFRSSNVPAPDVQV